MKKLGLRIKQLRNKCLRHIAMNVFLSVMFSVVIIGNFFRFILQGHIESLFITAFDTLIVTYLFIPAIKEWYRILIDLKQIQKSEGALIEKQ